MSKSLITIKGKTDGNFIHSIQGGIFDISPLSYIIARGYFLLYSQNNGKNWTLLNSVWID